MAKKNKIKEVKKMNEIDRYDTALLALFLYFLIAGSYSGFLILDWLSGISFFIFLIRMRIEWRSSKKWTLIF